MTGAPSEFNAEVKTRNSNLLPVPAIFPGPVKRDLIVEIAARHVFHHQEGLLVLSAGSNELQGDRAAFTAGTCLDIRWLRLIVRYIC